MTKLIVFDQRSTAYLDMILPFWPKLKEHTETLSKEQDDLLAVYWCHWKLMSTCKLYTQGWGLTQYPYWVGGKVTVQTTEPQCLLWGFFFSINIWENTFLIHSTLIYTYTYIKIYQLLWGRVKQVSASWATPAQRVIWYANNVDLLSRSDRVAIC